MSTVTLKDEDYQPRDYTVTEGVKLPLSNGSGFIEAYITDGEAQITDISSIDVRNKATARVVDANLVPENIAEGIAILGVVGTLEAGGSGGKETQIERSVNYQTLGFTNAKPSSSSYLDVSTSVTLPKGATIKSTWCKVFAGFGFSNIWGALNSATGGAATVTTEETEDGIVVTGRSDLTDSAYTAAKLIFDGVSNGGTPYTSGGGGIAIILEVQY